MEMTLSPMASPTVSASSPAIASWREKGVRLSLVYPLFHTKFG
jgi:hypothetical protein